MPRIGIPDGPGSERVRMWQHRPELGRAAEAFIHDVAEAGALPVRVREAARIRIAHINKCQICSEARVADMDVHGLDDNFYAEIDTARARTDLYSEQELLAIEFAERFSYGTESFTEEFWSRLKGAFDDGELVELSVLVGEWLIFGRISAVFELSVECPLRLKV